MVVALDSKASGTTGMVPVTAHGHSHGDGLPGGWERWSQVPMLRFVVGFIALIGFVTVVALAALWPTGEGRQQAIANADDLGLVSDRVNATVQEQRDGPCSYSTDDNPQTCRELTLIVEGDGPEARLPVILPEINLRFDSSIPSMAPGDAVILGYEPSTNTYFFADLDRRGPLLWLAIVFAVFVIGFGRSRGVLALSSMAFTVVALVGFIAASVLDGNNALVVCVVGASAIAIVSLYVTHGFSPTTTVALAGTLGVLLLTLGLAWVFFELSRITGLGTEEALILPFVAGDIDLATLLLGGAIIEARSGRSTTSPSPRSPWSPNSTIAGPTSAAANCSPPEFALGRSTSRQPSIPCSSPMRAQACRCCCCSRPRTSRLTWWPTPRSSPSRSFGPCAARWVWSQQCRSRRRWLRSW